MQHKEMLNKISCYTVDVDGLKHLFK